MAAQGVGVPPPRRAAPRGGPPLPAEVLEAPLDGGHLFVERMDDWRKALGLGHEGFARYLGMSKQYWGLLRPRPRGRTIGVRQRGVRERPELEHFLAAAIRERDWKRRQQG